MIYRDKIRPEHRVSERGKESSGAFSPSPGIRSISIPSPHSWINYSSLFYVMDPSMITLETPAFPPPPGVTPKFVNPVSYNLPLLFCTRYAWPWPRSSSSCESTLVTSSLTGWAGMTVSLLPSRILQQWWPSIDVCLLAYVSKGLGLICLDVEC